MTGVTFLKRSTVLLAALLSIANAESAAAAAEPFEIPVILPLTGGSAFLGSGERDALVIAEGVINAQGGIRGTPLHFNFQDDQSSPQVAVQLASKIRTHKSPIVLGSAILAMCNAMAPVLGNQKVMYCISPSIHPATGSTIFSAFISNHDLAEVLVRYFRSRGFKRLAMITSTDATGQSAKQGVEEAMKLPENSGMEMVASVRFNPSDVSVSAQVGQMRAANPQAVIAWTTGAPMGTVLKGMAQGGLDLPTATTDSNMTYVQMEQYADFLPSEMLYMSSPWPPHGPELQLPAGVDEQIKAMFAAYKAAGRSPDMAAPAIWDAGLLTAAALREVGLTATPEQVRAYLAKLKDWPGVNGMYDFTKVPQRGLDFSNTVVTRWDRQKKTWVIVSKPGGLPLAP
jgi:branched-chain amino acid transport system substrate-binding protein